MNVGAHTVRPCGDVYEFACTDAKTQHPKASLV